jgi:hypothetical protein
MERDKFEVLERLSRALSHSQGSVAGSASAARFQSSITSMTDKNRIITTQSRRELIDTICNEETKENTMRPYNYPLFLTRIRTYTPAQWFAKPACISAAMCSKYGWICSSPNQLSCQICNGVLIHDAADFIGNILQSELQSGHGTDCGWRKFSCPESFAYYPYEASEETLLRLNHRMSSFKAAIPLLNETRVSVSSEFRDQYSDMSVMVLNNNEKTLQMIECLSSDAEYTSIKNTFNECEKSESVFETGELCSVLGKAVYLSLCGWQASPSGGSVECELCGRCMMSLSTSLDLRTPPKSQASRNPLSDHRTFCPWIAYEDSSSPQKLRLGHLPGWRKCCDAVTAAIGFTVLKQSAAWESIEAESVYKKVRHTLDLASSLRRASFPSGSAF